MSIDKLGAQSAARTYVQNTDVARTATDKDAAAKAAHPHKGHRPDSVTLSANARSLAAAQEVVKQTPDVRTEKVAEIKQRVDDGTYFVPSSVLARNMVDAAKNSSQT
jgi:negative regulator of flagellin synthesis FlgM